MGRFLIFFGILIVFVAAGVFVFMMFETDHPIVAGAIESVACTDNETLRIERNNWSLPNGSRGENITFFCDIEPNVGRDVSGMGAAVTGGTFTVLLLTGMMFIFLGAFRLRSHRTQAFQNQFQSAMGGNSSSLQGQDFFEQGDGTAQVVNIHGDLDSLPPQTRAMLENMLGGMMSSATVVSSGQSEPSLTDRLEQLKEAYEKGLINREEYDKVRQAILDSMDD